MNKQSPYVMNPAKAFVSCVELIINSLMHISRELFIGDTKRNVYKMSGSKLLLHQRFSQSCFDALKS